MRRQHVAKAPLPISLLDRAVQTRAVQQSSIVSIKTAKVHKRAVGSGRIFGFITFTRHALHAMQWSAWRWNPIRRAPCCSALVGVFAPGFQRIEALRSLEILMICTAFQRFSRFIFRAHLAVGVYLIGGAYEGGEGQGNGRWERLNILERVGSGFCYIKTA